jgi:hypothetical protein
MKTTQEWFEQLSEVYKDKALKNMIDPKAQHYSLAGAISNGFVWEETPEGKDYWNGVFRELMYGEEFDPKLYIVPNSEIIESGLIEFNNNIEPDAEKAGNAPDLIKKHKKQKEEIK